VSLELMAGLAIGAPLAPDKQVSGNTSTGASAVGKRWIWPLSLPQLNLAIWETLWSTGEREFVLADQEATPVMPLPLVKLMSRRRAGLERRPDFEFMSARRVDPDSKGWPRYSNCRPEDIDQLLPPSVRRLLLELGLIDVVSRESGLEATGPNRNQLIGRFRPSSSNAVVCFYVLTRVVPTLRQSDLLAQ
jgi:hypothetical protein